MIRILVVFLLITGSVGLTQEELDMFTTSDRVDENTGLLGVVDVTVNGDMVTLSTNGVPDHEASARDNRRSSIVESPATATFPLNPTLATSPGCLPMGPIGYAKNGIPIFNAYTSEMTDAVQNEAFDSCLGHPSPTGKYHYHQYPPCVSPGYGQFVGVALDGFPIYGPEEVQSTDLDTCRGHMVNGQYRYELTHTFPYTLGCFAGDYPSYSGDKCNILTDPPTQAPPTSATTESPTLAPTTEAPTTRERSTRERTTRERTTRLQRK